MDRKTYLIIDDASCDRMSAPSVAQRFVRQSYTRDTSFSEEVRGRLGSNARPCPNASASPLFRPIDIPPMKNSVVLDLGCVRGRWRYFLAEPCVTFVVVEFLLHVATRGDVPSVQCRDAAVVHGLRRETHALRDRAKTGFVTALPPPGTAPTLLAFLTLGLRPYACRLIRARLDASPFAIFCAPQHSSIASATLSSLRANSKGSILTRFSRFPSVNAKGRRHASNELVSC